MVENVVTKPLGLVLIVVAHMVFNVLGQANVTGIVGSDVILQFTFNNNNNFTEQSHFAVHRTGQKKIAEYPQGRKAGEFEVYPHNNSVSWQTGNLTVNDRADYWATLFIGSSAAQESNKVKLIVRKESRSSTVPPMQTTTPVPEDRESSSYIIGVLVVLPVVLLAAVLPCLIWCLLRPKDKQQQQPPPQESSSPTVQETIEPSKNVPASSLVYSVLDFPKRPPAAMELNPSDTEYAAVSQKRTV